MCITFTVNKQTITHDLGQQQLVAGSSGVVQADFSFDESWEGFDVVAVFTNSAKRCAAPVRYTGEPIDIPANALVAGKLYVSLIGFGDNDLRKTTRKWDIQQAITVQECGALGDCDLLRNMVHECTSGEVSDADVATDAEVVEMLNSVFTEG